MNPEPMYVTSRKGHKTRILTPEEYDQFTSVMKNMRLKTIFEVMFYTGMRYVELQRLHVHPAWVLNGRGVIHLPFEAQKKVKRVQRERSIHIAPQIRNLLPYFFKNEPPASIQAWIDWLRHTASKAGFSDGYGFGARITRKTIESWMVVAGIPLNQICLWQGHDSMTSMNHYQGLAFTDGEVLEIKRRLAGWW